MKTRLPLAIPALACGVVLLASAAWANEQALHARVSFDVGGTLIRGAQDSDWSHAAINTIVLPGDSLWADKGGTAEIEFPGGNFLRMADGSRADVLGLGGVRAWVGAFYIHRLARAQNSFTVETPAGIVDVGQNASVRVDVMEDSGVIVSVRWGEAVVRTEGGPPETVRQGQRVFVDPGLLPSAPAPFDLSAEDAFDTWNRERTEYFAAGSRTAAQGASYTPATLGTADLGNYGEWVVVENRRVWRPTTVVNYVPFRYGHWSYVPVYGYTWVGGHPFCYVTSHYGRWHYYDRYGWCWSYDPVWSPAWAATIRYGDYYVWGPIGHNLRPVRYGSAHFTVGGVHFYYGAVSYTPVRYLGVGPYYVAPFRPTLAQNVTNINIWNIHIGSQGDRFRQRVRVPYDDSVRHTRDYNPRRSIRGPEIHANSRIAASERVRSLESGLGRTSFARLDRDGVRNVRTEAAARQNQATVRPVRIDPAHRSARPSAGAGDRVTTIRGRGDAIDVRRGDVPDRDPRTGRGPVTDPSDRAAARGDGVRVPRTPDAGGRTPVRGGRDAAPSGTEQRRPEPRVTTPTRTPSAPVADRVRTAPPSGETTETRGGQRTPARTGDAADRFERRDGQRAPTPRVTTPPQRTETPRPRVTSPQPRTETPQPRAQTPQRRTETPQPRVQTPQPRAQTPQRRTETPQPRVQTPQPRVQAPQPRVQTPQPRVQTPQPRVQTPQPRAQTPQPRVQTPQPRVQSPQPRVQTPQPRAQTPQPRVQSPQPRVQTPQPRVQSPSPRVQSPSPRVSSPPSGAGRQPVQSPSRGATPQGRGTGQVQRGR